MANGSDFRKAMHPGERVLWSGQPDPSYASLYPSRNRLAIAIAMATGLGFPVLVILGLFLNGSDVPTGTVVVLIATSIFFMVVAGAILFHYVRGVRRFREVTYVVTDQRVLTIRKINGLSLEIEDHAAAGITMLEVTPCVGELNHLWLGVKLGAPLGTATMQPVGFLAIKDARAARDVIATLPCAAHVAEASPRVVRVG